MRKKIVAVIGAADASPQEERTAEALGRLVAERGWILVTGGLGGVMAAASRGARSAGGLVVGIVPSHDANEFVDVAIKTGMGDARNAILAETADAFLAVGGSHGTLSEIAFALKRGKPVVGRGTWEIEGVLAAEDDAAAVDLVTKFLCRNTK